MITIRDSLDSDVAHIYKSGRKYMKDLGLPLIKKMYRKYLTLGPSVTFDYDGSPLATGGIVISESGIGMIWAFVSKRVEHCPIEFVRKVDRWVFNQAVKNNLRRIEALIGINDHVALRMAKYVGFNVEGVLRCINPDNTDAYIIGYIVDDFLG